MKWKDFFLWGTLILGLIFNIVYILSGAQDGYGFANLIEFIVAALATLLLIGIAKGISFLLRD